MTGGALPEAAIGWTPGSDPTAELMRALRESPIALRGLLPWSSNYAFLGEIAVRSSAIVVVYKPNRGERPLWDFPEGTLGQREVAAFEVSSALGWHLVPPTVFRDGPHGMGSVQYFVNLDQEDHFFVFREEPEYRSVLQKLVLFDILVNNADRKGGHCLRVGDGRIVAIDHGVCFNVQPKLRTVIWDFAGQPIPDDQRDALARLNGHLSHTSDPLVAALGALLAAAEIDAMRGRLAMLVAAQTFPYPPDNRRPYPWPLV